MIRTYTVRELEDLSGLTRRTIGDYVSKGLLSGPSHRGRGACYSQADVDVLHVIPRLRVLMKKEFPTLRALRGFVAQLSVRDIHSLARKTNADAIMHAVRHFRLRTLLSTTLPQLAPDRIDATLANLSPEQVRAIDTGQRQLGSILDLSKLLRSDDESLSEDGDTGTFPAAVDGSSYTNEAPGHRNHNGHNGHNGHNSAYRIGSSAGRSARDSAEGRRRIGSTRSWARDQLNGVQESAAVASLDVSDQLAPIRHESNTDRLSDIARRLERLERLLATE